MTSVCGVSVLAFVLGFGGGLGATRLLSFGADVGSTVRRLRYRLRPHLMRVRDGSSLAPFWQSIDCSPSLAHQLCMTYLIANAREFRLGLQLGKRRLLSHRRQLPASGLADLPPSLRHDTAPRISSLQAPD
ncbi:hypothetical protein RHIZ404_110003 [Rhizobium sp. EC-SD404]|nr:hypothetical protein RHIZ404_110003 [Rhizobium sp. EC-SD404]